MQDCKKKGIFGTKTEGLVSFSPTACLNPAGRSDVGAKVFLPTFAVLALWKSAPGKLNDQVETTRTAAHFLCPPRGLFCAKCSHA